MDLNESANECYKIALERFSKWHNVTSPINNIGMLKHLAGEVVEATQAFQKWSSEGDNEDDFADLQELKNDYELELADVIICALILAHGSQIDIERAVMKGIKKNEERAFGACK